MSLELVVNAGIRMLPFCAAVWLALRALRVRNPHVEALAWRVALVAGLALPVLLFLRVAPSFATQLQLPVLTVDGAGSRHAPAIAVLSGPSSRLLSTIYLAGVLLLLARLATGLAALWRICRVAVPLPLPNDVRVSSRIHSPATFGGVVLLPAESGSWPAARLDAALAHELAHVRSRDGYWCWLAQLHCAFFWFSPHAWWLRHRLAVLAETTSDDAVVAADHDRVTYAALLLDFARNPNNRSVAMSVAESNVSRRIDRLLAGTPPAKAPSRAVRWSTVAALIPVVVLAAATTRAIASGSADVAGPRIVQPANPDDYYPGVAIQESVSGFAVVEVDLDALGQLVDARVVKVEPAEPRFGFSDAALQVARNTGYVNPGGQPSSLRFMVKFALTDQ